MLKLRRGRLRWSEEERYRWQVKAVRSFQQRDWQVFKSHDEALDCKFALLSTSMLLSQSFLILQTSFGHGTKNVKLSYVALTTKDFIAAIKGELTICVNLMVMDENYPRHAFDEESPLPSLNF